MKQKKLDKKIMSVYINHAKTPRLKNMKIKIKDITNNYLITKYELINKILNQKMNLICFDCRKNSPKNISINNAIFLCQNCAANHKKNFSEKISFIIDNNLNLLSINYLRYLFIGGNQNLDNFINYVFPGLQNYPPEILYRTQALIYYRDNLKFKINEGPEPIYPNELMAYKIVSEKGLINIRDKSNIFHNLNINIDNNDINSNSNNNDIINNYFNNYNNTYNTYNNISITNEDNQESEKNTIGNIGTIGNSLSNKAFFNEMKNLFGKRYIKTYKKSFDAYKKLTPIRSFKDLSNINYKKIKDKNDYSNKPLTCRLNESLNYSFSKAKEINKNSFKNLYIINNNKSAISFLKKEKSPKNSNNTFCSSPRYTKPNIKIKNMKNTYGINMKLIDNGKFKNIYNNKKKFNNILKQKNILKHFKIQKKTKSLFNLNKNNINNNTSLTNINIKDIIPYKEKLIPKANNKIGKNNLYFYTDYTNIPKDMLTNDNNDINTKENKLYNNKITYYNNCNKKNKILKKMNNINASFEGFTKRRPIKVNLKMNFERKNKAIKDKKEQEKLEQDALYNIYSDSKDNDDIFTNIIYLNKTNL